MKLPWDRKYLKISFHVIVTFAAVYASYILLSAAAYGLVNAGEVLRGAGFALRRLLSVFSPLMIGAIAAYLLEPAVAFYQRSYDKMRKRSEKANNIEESEKRRIAGVVLTLMSFAVIIAIIILYVKISLKPRAGMSLSDELSLSFARTANELHDFYTGIEVRLMEMGALEYLSVYLESMLNAALGVVRGIGDATARSAASVGGGIVKFLAGLVISVYLMRDKDAILKKLCEISDVVLKRRLSERLKDLLSDINAVFSGYIRGQLTDAVIMAVLIGGWLTFLKVDFAVMIGIFSGLSNLIPYFGALMGLALAVVVALISGETATAVYAAIGILILQQIDAVFIVPKVVGESVELSPVAVLLSLTVAGSLFGLTGMLFAVPVTAVIKMFLTRWLDRRKRRALL